MIETIKEQESWDVLLKRHIQLLHSKHGDYKTTLKTGQHLYIVVTRVNYLVIKFWNDRRNELIKKHNIKSLEPITKPNWLTMTKSYRREQDKIINNIINEKKQ